MHEYLTTILQPFLKIRNPKKIAPYRKVRSFFYVSLMDYSMYILFYIHTLLYTYSSIIHTLPRLTSSIHICRYCAPAFYRLRDARTVFSLSTSPSSKQYPSIPHLRAPSIFRLRSSTKKHSSGFRWKRSNRCWYISFCGFRHCTSAENRTPSKQSMAGITSL